MEKQSKQGISKVYIDQSHAFMGGDRLSPQAGGAKLGIHSLSYARLREVDEHSTQGFSQVNRVDELSQRIEMHDAPR